MEIWEERQISKYGKKETDRLYHYFQMYLAQNGQRSVKRLHEDLENSKNNSKNTSKNRVPKIETLRTYCLEFHWVDRVKAYDQHQLDLAREKREEANLRAEVGVSQFHEEEVPRGIARVGYSTEALSDAQKSYENGDLSLKEYIYFLDVLSRVYNRDLESVDKLAPVPEKDRGTVINNLNGNNNHMHQTFHGLMQKKGDVIDEYLRDEDRRREGKSDTG